MGLKPFFPGSSIDPLRQGEFRATLWLPAGPCKALLHPACLTDDRPADGFQAGPGSVRVISECWPPMIMNLGAFLAPGDAIFLETGQLHAYLSGTASN